jgi:hypothetical protein
VVTIKDTDGNLVDGATVSAAWSGDYSGSASGVTGSNGTVSFQSGNVRKANAAFTFTVNNVAKTGYTYDSALNKETSDSITCRDGTTPSLLGNLASPPQRRFEVSGRGKGFAPP